MPRGKAPRRRLFRANRPGPKLGQLAGDNRAFPSGNATALARLMLWRLPGPSRPTGVTSGPGDLTALRGFSASPVLLRATGFDSGRRLPTLASMSIETILRKARHCVRLNDHLEHSAPSCSSTPARWGWRGSCRSGRDRVIDQDARRIGSSSRTQQRQPSVVRQRRTGDDDDDQCHCLPYFDSTFDKRST